MEISLSSDLHMTNILVDDTVIEKNELTRMWSSTFTTNERSWYLTLPGETVSGHTSNWIEDDHSKYISNKIYVREPYCKAITIFTQYANSQLEGMKRLLLSGTSDIEKRFFTRYFIWRLLHPDGLEITVTPNTILYRMARWHLYHEGRFYFVKDVG